MAKKTYKKRNYWKSLPKVGSTIALTVAMASVLATPANASEVDEAVLAEENVQLIPLVEEIVTEEAISGEVIAPVEANEAIVEENTETVAENEEVAENNEQVEQKNEAAVEENEVITNGALADPNLDLPEAPAVPETEGTDAEGYNEEITDYNQKVDDYNEAVDGYNDGVDDYNAEADAYDQQAQEKYEEDKASFEEAKTEHENAEKQHEEELKQYEEDTKAYEDYQDALEQYEEDKKLYDEELAQYEKDQTQHEEDTKAYEDYQDALEQYEEDKKVYDEELAQYEKDQTQHEEDTKAYEDYLDAMAKYEEEKKIYDADQAQYEKDYAQYQSDNAAYQNYLAAKDTYDAAYKTYQDALAQYDKDKAAYDLAYQTYLNAKATYDQEKAAFEKAEAAYEAEAEIYDEVTEYNQQVENKNNEIENKNDALEDDLHADNVTNVDDVGANNDGVDVDPEVEDVLSGHKDLDTWRSDLKAAEEKLNNHPGKGAALGSQEYTDYLAAVESYNNDVTAYNNAIDDYNLAVDSYNAAVDTYNENKEPTTDSSTGTGTEQGSSDIDWGNININDHKLGHIDVKYKAAASKDVTIDADGKENYSDSVTQYNITGVYPNEDKAEGGKSTDYGLVYDNDGAGSQKPGVQDLNKDAAYNEFGSNHFGYTGVSLDPATGTVSFYVTMKDGGNNVHGITVNLDAGSVYAEGSYYKAQPNDFLSKFVDKNGNGLKTVTIDGEEYYDISGESVFLISALTCDGMTNGGWWYQPSNELTPDGLDLILNLQTMIEVHQADNAQKISYRGYEKGKTAQATAPTDPGEFEGKEPNAPKAPTEPKFEMTEPTLVEEPTAPTAPTAPDMPDEIPEPGTPPVAPIAPNMPDEVPEPGTPPVAPIAPNMPDEVPEPGTPPVAPIAPNMPDEVPNPGNAPEGPGEFTGHEPEAPAPAHRLDHAQKLEKLEEQIIAEIPEPGIPEIIDMPDWEPTPINEGEVEILDEEVPLAAAPKTGDLSGLWAAISGLSLGGITFLNRKRKEEEA